MEFEVHISNCLVKQKLTKVKDHVVRGMYIAIVDSTPYVFGNKMFHEEGLKS